MKLNFWQWLGVVLLIIGVAWWFYDRRSRAAAPAPANPPAVTAPAP
jgi:hypothetical protein